MKVYIAKDWRGCHVYSNEPKLLERLPSFPPTWSGHELKEFNVNNSFIEEEIPYRKFITRYILWAILKTL